MKKLPFTVLRTARWERRMGYAGQQGVSGQATMLRYGNAIAYVRENIRMDTFMMGSQERLSVSGGAPLGGGKFSPGRIPHHAVHILELAAPASVWPVLASVVHTADGQHRKVVKSPRWTVKRARELFP